MDKYMENAALRVDLQYVTDQMQRIIKSVEDDCIDWHEIKSAKEIIGKVYTFYKFKEKA